MRVAVTGAAGFLGRHLCEALTARGDVVLPLVRAVDAKSPARARALADVLAEPRLLVGTDVVVHAAAARHRHGVDPATYNASNVDLVEQLLRACQGRVRRFVYVSSVGVYGFPVRLPIDESFPYAPVTTYSESKVAAEQVVRRVAKEVGVEWVIVRPTIIYGSGDTNGMLDKLARMVRSGTYLLVGDGRNTLHHTYISDTVAGVMLATAHPAAVGEDFILAGPETTTLGELSRLVAGAVGKRIPRVRVPLAFARAVASAVDLLARRGWAFAEREPPIDNEKLDVMCVPIAFDGSKARRVLGFEPRVGYEEGVRRTLRASDGAGSAGATEAGG